MSDLKKRADSWLYDFGVDNNWKPQLLEEAKLLFKEFEGREGKLIGAIKKTITDNLNLADGENCTLITLKLVLRELGIEGEG